MTVIKPFAIESFPIGDAHWVVVPSPDGDGIQVRIDTGGGNGPLVAEAEWIPARYERILSNEVGTPGFLAWHLEGDTVFTVPIWVPTEVLRATQTMAVQMYTEQQKAKAVGA